MGMRSEEEYFRMSRVFCGKHDGCAVHHSSTGMVLEHVFVWLAFGTLTACYDGEGCRVFAVSRINK